MCGGSVVNKWLLSCYFSVFAVSLREKQRPEHSTKLTTPEVAQVTGIANDGSPDLQQVRREFPQFAIWQETTPGRSRYVARSRDLCRNPYAVIAANLAELRDALANNPADR